MTSRYQPDHFLNKGGFSSFSSVSMTSELFFIPVTYQRCYDQADGEAHDQADGRVFDEASYDQSYYNGYYYRDVPSAFHELF